MFISLLVPWLIALVPQQTDPWKRIQEESTPQAASQPASRPTSGLSPFRADALEPRRSGSRPGVIRLSSGESLPGWISTTTGKPLKLFLRSEGTYVDLKLSDIAEIRTLVEWERLEDDWRWLEQGSDVKIKTGKRYPARKTYYAVRTNDGRRLIADIRAPLWLQLNGKTRTLTLHSRDKGAIGVALKDLVYVSRIEFSQDRMRTLIAKQSESGGTWARRPVASRPAGPP